MPATAISRLGRYEILARIGAGGMGEVYKARDTLLNRLVALKVLPVARASDAVLRRRLFQEAQSASALNSAHIITVHDIGSEDGRDYIVMEFVAGRSLDALMPRSGMRLQELLKIAIQVADGLGAAHTAGIIHRDLKPSNIIVSDEGVAKVLDFGLARLTEISPEDATRSLEPITGEGTVVGTAAYMSPEQAEGRPLDARTDVFSFGSVLYEMATGRHAFQGSSHASTIAAILTKEPPPLHEVAPGLPDELERIICQCLRKDAGKRLQHMADLKVRLEDLREESSSGKAIAATPARKPWWRPLAGLAAASAIVAAAVGLWVSRRAPDAPARVVPLTSFAGSEDSPSFSPDGTQVAFAWNGERQDNWDIYVKLLDSATALRLTSSPDPESVPAWSPDGRQIAFLRYGQSPGVYSVSPLGGSPQKIADFPAAFGALSWSPDGKYLAVARRYRGKPEPGAGAIYAVSVDGGEPRPILVPDAGQWYAAPAIARDGGSLAFKACTGAFTGSSCGLYVVTLKAGLIPSGSARRIVPKADCCGLAWSGDGRSVIFGKGLEGHESFWSVDVRRGGAPQPLGLPGDSVRSPAVSAAGGRLAYARISRQDRIWRLQLGAEPQPFVASSAMDGNPEFAPDGHRVLFTSSRGLEGNSIWLAKSDGTDVVQLTRGPEIEGSPSWSPDGRWIAFDAQDGNAKWQIKVVDASGGYPRPLTSGAFDNAAPRWSHDGKWIYFASDRTGRYEIWRMPVDSGKPEQLTHDGGYAAAEAADGRALYYVKEGPSTPLFRRSLTGGEEQQVLGPVLNRNFVVLEDGIYYIGGSRDFPEIRFHDFRKNGDRVLSRVPSPLTLGFSVSPDRKTFLFTHIVGTGTDLMLAENFR